MLEFTAPARLLHEGGTLLGCFEQHATPQVSCLGLKVPPEFAHNLPDTLTACLFLGAGQLRKPIPQQSPYPPR